MDGNGASAAALAARIETENNSQYRNREKVAKLKAGLYENLAGSCDSNPDRESCYTNAFQAGDRMAAAYDRVLTLQHYPAASMAPEQMEVFTQAVLDLAPGVSSASALYELINGRSAVKDEEVSRIFATVGVIPVVGGMVKQGGKMTSLYAKVEHAVDAGKVVSNGAPSLTAAQRLKGQLTAQQISSGHAYGKHVVQQNEFVGVGINSQADFTKRVEDVIIKIINPAES